MTNFTLQFLGQFHVRVDERPIHDFHSEKARALLAYLALEPQEHARSQLATLFWPEIGDQYARTNLRNTLYRLRQTLDGALPGAADQLIAVTRQAVRFNADSATVDALRFQASLAEAQQAPTPDPDRLAEALELYHGELLPGFGVDDAPTFEEWLLLRRELLHQQAILAFHMVTTAYETTGQYAQALRMVGRQLTLDPYREESHRQSMRLLAYMGHPAQALQQLERMRHLLREELGVDPSAETVALGQAIASGEIAERDRSSTPLVNRSSPPSPGSSSLGSSSPGSSSPGSSSPGSSSPGSSSLVSYSSGSPPPLDLSDVPEPGLFLGRAQERARLVQWLGAEQCRVVAILGLGGMGKTTLAAQSVREIATGEERRHFDAIYWRSLLNAPSLTDLLSPLLQHLSEQQLTKLPTSVDDQLRLLLEQLSRQRVLLVLDNFESILLPEEAGTYRPGYEGYGQLIHQLATLTHQSRLLLTSRERPRGYARLERDGYPIRSLPLSGLDNVAGRQLLIQRGLSGAGGEETILLERYSGNPLALKLVADTVDEIFGGDVMEFLHEEVLLFDDIRTVLDQQFARLTDGEQQILFWLAIEREATPLPVLRNNLLHVPPQGFLVETMRNLQRRSLIERQADGFALQNVVTEYLTDRLIDSVCTELETGELKHLHEHALLKAQAKEYVRATQARLILKPIGEQLIERLGRSGAQLAMQRVLAALRTHELRTGDYAAGNLLNLLLCHNFDPAQMDFSHLAIRQAYLQGASLAHVNFAHATFFESLFTNHFGRVAALAISPDSQLLAVGANDGNIRLWQLRDGQLLCILGGHQSTVVSVAFRPDGRQLVSSSGSHGTLYLWDVASGARLFSLSGHQGGVGVVTFSPDGTLIASGGHDGTIRLWDAQSGKPLAILEKHTDWVRALAFDPSGALLISSGLDQSCCYVWQRQVSQAGEKPADAAHYRCEGTLDGHTMPVLSAAFSPNGALLATGSTDATVILWDVLQRTAIATLPDQGGEVHFVAFSPDGAVLAVNNRLTNINLWDVANRRLINVLHRHERQVWDIAISNDGKTLASGGSDGLVHLWDIRNPQRAQLIRTLHGSVQPIYALRINPQGDLFATGEEEGRVRLWQLEEDRGE
ncbi:MAG: NACHT domain-containing protein, partial [Caldilineaceae bacterium]|nr:NACHT domain-containing protein [Caldilineaceae bacterium]